MSLLELPTPSLSLYIQKMGAGSLCAHLQEALDHHWAPGGPTFTSAGVQHAPAMGWFLRSLLFPCFREQVGNAASSGYDCLESDPWGPEAFGD